VRLQELEADMTALWQNRDRFVNSYLPTYADFFCALLVSVLPYLNLPSFVVWFVGSVGLLDPTKILRYSTICTVCTYIGT
jgi:hypothetical protein